MRDTSSTHIVPRRRRTRSASSPASSSPVPFQFGALAPRSYAEGSGSESWNVRAEYLVETSAAMAQLHLRVRCLQVQSRFVERRRGDGTFEAVRQMEAGGRLVAAWDEA